MSLVTDYVDYNEQSGRFNVGVTAVVRVTLRDGVFHEDVGYGLLENSKGKGAAMDKVCSLLLAAMKINLPITECSVRKRQSPML